MRAKKFLFFSFLFVFLFSLIFLSTNVSALASFNPIPNRDLSMFMTTGFDLDTYCYSTSFTTGCSASSYNLQFINPDTSQPVFLFPSGFSSNSYFDISLGTNGVIIIHTFNKVLSRMIIDAHASDIPLSSQPISSGFFLSVNGMTAPQQTQSLSPLILNGNDTAVYSVSNFFTNYNSISVSYSDPVLAQSIYLPLSTGGICSVGAIKVCLNGTNAGQSYITITGRNISYFGKIVIIAYNIAGQTALSNGGLSVTVIPQVSSSALLTPPTRKPFSVAPLSLGFNELKTLNLDLLWSNYTYVNATFINPDTSNNVTVRLGSINGTAYNDNFNSNSVFSLSLISSSFPTTILQVYSNRTSASFPVFLTACNNIGCNSTDIFGNQNIEWVYINGTLPTAVPISIAPISMGFNSLKSFDLRKIFSNFDTLKIMFEDINSRDLGVIPSKNSVKLSKVLNQNLNTSSYDFGVAQFEGGDFSVIYHYLISLAVHTGQLTINGQTVLTSPVAYADYYVNSVEGQDLNFTSTGDAVIYSIQLTTDQVNATVSSNYNEDISVASNFSTSSFLITNVTNSTGNSFTNQTNIAFPVFFTRLYQSGIFSINSGDTSYHLRVYPSACNSIGCIGGPFLNNRMNNFTINFIINGVTNPELNQINNSAISGTINAFLGLFPSADTLELRQKVFYVIISMLFITVLIFAMGFGIFKSQSAVPLIVISGILNLFLFVLFIAIGYIPAVIWITASVIIVTLIFLKLFMKGGG